MIERPTSPEADVFTFTMVDVGATGFGPMRFGESSDKAADEAHARAEATWDGHEDEIMARWRGGESLASIARNLGHSAYHVAGVVRRGQAHPSWWALHRRWMEDGETIKSIAASVGLTEYRTREILHECSLRSMPGPTTTLHHCECNSMVIVPEDSG